MLGPIIKPAGGWAQKSYTSIREYAVELILRVHHVNEEGRLIGFDYEHIRKLILRMFPCVRYAGPHKGKPTQMTFKELHEIACSLNRDGVRLPVRPRRKVGKRRCAATIAAPPVVLAPPATKNPKKVKPTRSGTAPARKGKKRITATSRARSTTKSTAATGAARKGKKRAIVMRSQKKVKRRPSAGAKPKKVRRPSRGSRDGKQSGGVYA